MQLTIKYLSLTKIRTMKKQLLIASLAITSILNAQSLTQTNEPTVGQSSTMYLCDSNATNLASVTGNTAVWNYSQLGKYTSQLRTINIIDPTTTANAPSFSGATSAFEIQNFITTYYSSTSGARNSQGFVFQEPTLGDVIAEYSSNNEVLMTYPFAYSNTSTDNFAGTLSFSLNGIPQNPSCIGTVTSSIDGQGSLTVGNTTIPNVIRYRIEDHTLATITFVGDIEFIRTQYEYYDLANSQMPIFIHANAIIQNVGSTTPLINRSLVLSSTQPTNIVGANAGILFNNLANFSVYPNPTKGELTINGEFKSDAQIRVIDQTGREIISALSLSNVSKIDLSSIDKGLYTVEIINNGVKSTKNIVVE